MKRIGFAVVILVILVIIGLDVLGKVSMGAIKLSVAPPETTVVAPDPAAFFPPTTAAPNQETKPDVVAPDPTASTLKQASTVGNHTWVPVNLDGDLDDPTLVKVILELENAFEVGHPDLIVPPGACHLQVRTRSLQFGPKVFGIWIDHRKNPDYRERI